MFRLKKQYQVFLVSWDEAYDLTACNFKKLQAKYGKGTLSVSNVV